jgi:hypothetical protein
VQLRHSPAQLAVPGDPVVQGCRPSAHAPVQLLYLERCSLPVPLYSCSQRVQHMRVLRSTAAVQYSWRSTSPLLASVHHWCAVVLAVKYIHMASSEGSVLFGAGVFVEGCPAERQHQGGPELKSWSPQKPGGVSLPLVQGGKQGGKLPPAGSSFCSPPLTEHRGATRGVTQAFRETGSKPAMHRDCSLFRTCC